jgi:hypothetical protein
MPVDKEAVERTLLNDKALQAALAEAQAVQDEMSQERELRQRRNMQKNVSVESVEDFHTHCNFCGQNLILGQLAVFGQSFYGSHVICSSCLGEAMGELVGRIEAVTKKD